MSRRAPASWPASGSEQSGRRESRVLDRHRRLRLGADWVREERAGFGPFVTREVLRRVDGTVVVWESRRHRKQRTGTAGSTWWAPTAVGWWIGVLFAVGSFCFALGSFPPYANVVGAMADNVTYFVGSLFFTTAAFLQYCQVVWADGGPDSIAAWPRRPASRPSHVPNESTGGHRACSSSAPCSSTRAPPMPSPPRRGALHPEPSRVAAGRAGLDLLPRRQLALLGRSGPRRLELASAGALLVDRAAQPGRFDRLRGLRRCLENRAKRLFAKLGPDEPRHLRGSRVFPGGRGSAAPRTDRGRRRRSRASRCCLPARSRPGCYRCREMTKRVTGGEAIRGTRSDHSS